MDQEQLMPSVTSSEPHTRQRRMAIAEEYPGDADRGIGANNVGDAGEESQEANQEEANLVLEMLTEALHRVSSSRPQHGPECSIYRVPQDIRLYDQEAYTPKVVSIGPYHYSPNFTSNGHTKHPYLDMQACKFRCLHSFISQQGRPGTELHGRHRFLLWLHHMCARPEDCWRCLWWAADISTQINYEGTLVIKAPTNEMKEPSRVESLLRRCFLLVKRHEARIKSYYADEIAFTADGFAGLILLDACFILHLLLRPADRYSVAGRVWIWTLVKHDLLLLENQIPFFILYELRDILAAGGDSEVDLVQKSLDLFQDIHPPATKTFSSEQMQHGQVLHLLHLFYLSRLPDPPSLPPRPPESSPPVWIPCATELTDFGVKFINNNKAKSFLDINFTSKGVMEIPSLLIDDHSRDLFRNLIAFEQCYPHTGCHVTVYAAFMDCIINTEKDLRLLHLNGVIVNRMSADQDLTRFFGRLCTGVHFAKDRFYLANVFADVTEYEGDAYNRCRAEFMRTYCSNSWAVFAGVVSVIFFVFTVLQTFFTIFPYYNPRG